MWKVIVDSFDAHSATSFRWWPSSFSSIVLTSAIFSRYIESANFLNSPPP
jgi:hypothetical protein